MRGNSKHDPSVNYKRIGYILNNERGYIIEEKGDTFNYKCKGYPRYHCKKYP